MKRERRPPTARTEVTTFAIGSSSSQRTRRLRMEPWCEFSVSSVVNSCAVRINHRGHRELSEAPAQFLPQNRRLWLRAWLTLRVVVRARLEHITVARAHGQLRPIHPHSDRSPLSRLRSLLRIVTKAVLATQLFRD